jgi:hypothetical protein
MSLNNNHLIIKNKLFKCIKIGVQSDLIGILVSQFSIKMETLPTTKVNGYKTIQ